MSSDVIVEAIDINKVYPDPLKPFARFKEAVFGVKARQQSGFHVLHDVSVDVKRGETVGITGRNGAGKSTLLGIIGNVIEPTSGRVERYGRIATLLEVTTGFNAEFTGRENAMLFCSIHGMSSKASRERLPKIAEFADIGRYFDLPIRTYSSGMLARLGQSIAYQPPRPGLRLVGVRQKRGAQRRRARQRRGRGARARAAADGECRECCHGGQT